MWCGSAHDCRAVQKGNVAMSFLAPLRASLFRYRKRKQISLDGTVAGLDPQHYRRSQQYAEPSPISSPQGRSPRADEYDPVHSMGYPASPHYEQPDVADDPGCHGITPPERFWLPNEPVGIHERPVNYDAMLISDAIGDAVRQDWQEMHDRAVEPPQHAEAAPGFFQQMLDSMMPSDAIPGQYDGADMPQELFEQEMATAAGLDPMQGQPSDHLQPNEAEALQGSIEHDIEESEGQFNGAMAPAEMAYGGHEPGGMLEGAVERQFDQMMNEMEEPVPAPEEMYPDPFVVAQAMFDEQMQLLMNPFMMPGPMM
jgi:hypothetical protein